MATWLRACQFYELRSVAYRLTWVFSDILQRQRFREFPSFHKVTAHTENTTSRCNTKKSRQVIRHFGIVIQCSTNTIVIDFEWVAGRCHNNISSSVNRSKFSRFMYCFVFTDVCD